MYEPDESDHEVNRCSILCSASGWFMAHVEHFHGFLRKVFIDFVFTLCCSPTRKFFSVRFHAS